MGDDVIPIIELRTSPDTSQVAWRRYGTVWTVWQVQWQVGKRRRPLCSQDSRSMFDDFTRNGSPVDNPVQSVSIFMSKTRLFCSCLLGLFWV